MGERGRLARRRRPGSPDVTQTPLDCGIMLDVYDGGLTRDQELQGPLAPTASPGLGAHRGLAGAGGSSGARPSAPPGGPGAGQQAPLAPRVSQRSRRGGLLSLGTPGAIDVAVPRAASGASSTTRRVTPSVVCLHGLRRTPSDWDDVRPGLARFGTVRAPLLPPRPDDALAGADAAIAAGDIVIGHSMGRIRSGARLAHPAGRHAAGQRGDARRRDRTGPRGARARRPPRPLRLRARCGPGSSGLGGSHPRPRRPPRPRALPARMAARDHALAHTCDLLGEGVSGRRSRSTKPAPPCAWRHAARRACRRAPAGLVELLADSYGPC